MRRECSSNIKTGQHTGGELAKNTDAFWDLDWFRLTVEKYTVGPTSAFDIIFEKERNMRLKT